MLDLVPFSRDHFDELASWFSDEHALRAWGGPDLAFPLDAAQMSAMIEDEGIRVSRSALVQNALVGHGQVVFDHAKASARLARIAVSPEHRGKAYGTDLVRQLCKLAFSRALIERVELRVYAWNAVAVRTYRSLGFVETSQAAIDEDLLIMSLGRASWSSQDLTSRG